MLLAGTISVRQDNMCTSDLFVAEAGGGRILDRCCTASYCALTAVKQVTGRSHQVHHHQKKSARARATCCRQARAS